MAGEEQYINPIIQAMAGLRQRQEHAQDLALETQRLKENSAHQAATLKELQTYHEQEHDIQQKHLEAEAAMREAQRMRDQAAQAGTLIQLAQSGAAPALLKMFPGVTMGGGGTSNPAIPQGTTPPGLPPDVSATAPQTLNYGGAEIPLSDIQNAGLQKMKNAAQAISMNKTAELGAEQPFVESNREAQETSQEKLARYQADLSKELTGQKQDWEDTKIAKELANRLDVAKLERGTQFGIAKMKDATERLVSGFSDDPAASSRITTRAMMLGLGIAKPNNSKIDQAAQASLASQGWKPQVDPSDASTVKNLSAMTELLGKLQDFANTRSDNKLGAYVQGLSATHSPAETDTQNKLAIIKTDIIKAASSLEGQKGRVLSKQFGIETDALTDPHITQAQATERVHNMQAHLEDEVDKATAGMSDAQKDAFLKYHQVKLPRYATYVGNDPALKGHRIVSYDGGKTTYDAQTGKPIAIPQGPAVPVGQPIQAIPPAGMQQGTISAPPPPQQ
jgi:hypothetical protein